MADHQQDFQAFWAEHEQELRTHLEVWAEAHDVADRSLIDDALQETWIEGAQAWPRSGPPLAYLRLRAVSRLTNLLRNEGLPWQAASQGAPAVALEAQPDPGADVVEAVASAERRELVSEILPALPAELQSVLRLSYFDALSIAQTAERLAISPATARSRLGRAHLAFRAAAMDRGINAHTHLH